MSAPETGPRRAQAEWRHDGADAVLQLAGDWRGMPAPLPAPPANASRLRIQAEDITWDARLASALWQLLQPLAAESRELKLDGLPPGLARILTLALPAPRSATAPPPAQRSRRPHWVTEIGHRSHDAWDRALATLSFVGELLLALARLLRGRSDMRAADFAWQLDQCGPRSVPIVSLVCALVGLIVAYMGAVQLARFGAQVFIADLVTIGVVREIAPLITAVILSGRVGAAFAAQIGSMVAAEEVDALRTLGIAPVEHLALPRVLALAVVTPLLAAYGAIVAMLMGGLVAVTIFGVEPLAYLNNSERALAVEHVAVGLVKATSYGVLVGIAGCRQGLAAGRSAQAVGAATTKSVVQSIVWIVVAASVLTVLFQRLGW
ncbi:MAG: ABC transporter permease [Rubrivivax sp.]